MKLTKEVKIGLALLAAITALIFGLNFLKGKNLFTNRTHYYALYDNIDGLAEIPMKSRLPINAVPI